MPKSTGENWMGAPAVAAYLGVTLRTVYAIIDEGQLPGGWMSRSTSSGVASSPES